MARLTYSIGSSARHRQPAAFRGIDGRKLAEQYVLNRKLESHRQSREWHYPREWQAGGDMSASLAGFDGTYSGLTRPNQGGLLRRIAIWLSKVGGE